MKILHIITGLNQGGAEGTLFRLIQSESKSTSHSVISLMDVGLYGPKLSNLGINVFTLNQSSDFFSPLAFTRMRNIIKDIRPDVVQTWMYHSDLLGGLAARSLGIPVVWGLRHSSISINDLGFKTWMIGKFCAFFSHYIPYCVVSCSQCGINLHLSSGYKDKFVYIPNGFNITEANLLVSHPAVRCPPIFGHAARFHPVKDHAGFLSAVSILKDQGLSCQIDMVGNSVSLENPEFSELVPENVCPYVRANGPCFNMKEFYSKIDCFVMSSACGEAFPNVVAEAMLAGLPCIVTDVGDAAEIVGDTGWVVPAKDPHALAAAMHQVILAMDDTDAWAERKAAACARIMNLYSMDKMQSRFEAVWTAAMEN